MFDISHVPENNNFALWDLTIIVGKVLSGIKKPAIYIKWDVS